MKVLVGAFNQEKALEGAFSVIVKFLPMIRLQLYFVHMNVSRNHLLLSIIYPVNV